MPIPLLLPLGVLAVAIAASQRAPSGSPTHKTIEACTAMCKASWIKEDGVVRVYAEDTELVCAKIVVEIDPKKPPRNIPKRIFGFDVSQRPKSED